jgi:hypothetical protein
VEHGDGIGGEELSVTADAVETHAEVLGGVVGDEGVDVQAAVETGVEGAIAAQGEPVVKLGEADEHEGEESTAVPLVVEEDVEVVEGVLVEEMGFVEQEDGEDPVAAELFDVGGDGVEDGGRGGRGREAEGETELAVGVAPSEGGVVAVGEAESLRGQLLAERAEHAGLADAGFAGEDNRLAGRQGVEELVDELAFGGGEPEVVVVDLLGEGMAGEAEVSDPGAHELVSVEGRGVRPTARSRSARGGSKGTGGCCGLGSTRTARRRRALRTGSTG